jgi:hypothetical protein
MISVIWGLYDDKLLLSLFRVINCLLISFILLLRSEFIISSIISMQDPITFNVDPVAQIEQNVVLKQYVQLIIVHCGYAH